MNFLRQINEWLGNYNNVIGILGLIIAIVAMWVSICSYQEANQKANLYLMYRSYDYDFAHGIQYENGKGQILLSCNKLDEEENSLKKGHKVTKYRPGGEVEFILENRGKVAAKNAVINFKFVNMELAEFKEEEWTGISHNHGLGTWSEIRWNCSDEIVIHKGIPQKFSQFRFNKSIIYDDAYIEVILSADNANTKTFTIPIIIEEVDF